MISCFKGSATEEWKTDFENTHAISYTSIADEVDNEPKISKIVESFKQFNVFKFSAYRTAFKLRTIQKASKLHLVSLPTIVSVLKDFQLDSQSLDEVINSDSTRKFILELYREASKTVGFAEDCNVMSNLFCAFLQNAFIEGEHSLLSAQMKITLILFSAAKLSEKHKYMFYYCSSDGIMSKKGLTLLLKTLSKLAEIVGEQVTFGSHLIPSALNSCLKYCKGKITEKKFRRWLLLEPQTLVWLSTLQRITVSEKTEHLVYCDYCHISPLQGLRYKCLQCMSYNLCQNCFLCGFFNQGHKESHCMQEFCLPASVWQETKAALNTIKNKLPFAKCPNNAYLSFDEESLYGSSNLDVQESIRNSIRIATLKKSTSAYLVKELTNLIAKLETDQKQMEVFGSVDADKINLPSTCPGSNLQDINQNLCEHLQKLKDLLKCLKAPETTKKETGVVSPVPHVPFHKKDQYFESTPLNAAALPLQSKENIPPLAQSLSAFDEATEIRRKNSSLQSNFQMFSPEDKENFTLSTSYKGSLQHSPTVSLELTKILNSSSPLSWSARLENLNENLSKVSPLFLYSGTELEEPLRRKSADLSSPCGSQANGMNFLSGKRSQSTFTINQDGSLEIMEQELQAMLNQLEELLPQVSSMANDSRVEKEKMISALSEMEDAIQKLSHLSFEVSTGSTDL